MRPEGRDAELIVIGGGAAGLMAAIAAAPRVQTLLVTDGPLGRSNTIMAQGGLHAPGPDPQSPASMMADMRASARSPIDEARLQAFVDAIPETIAALERWGLCFDRTPDGALRRRYAGGLSEPRILSVRDRLGPALFRVLRRRLEASEAALMTGAAARGLRREDGGFRLLLAPGAAKEALRCRALVVCTGGLTYQEARRRKVRSTNPRNENHRFSSALAALGLPQVQPEAFQYQPFGIVDPDDGRSLGLCVPESITNHPVRILDRHGQEVCSPRLDRLDLTRALFAARDAGRAVALGEDRCGFRLTLGELDSPSLLAREFPKLHRLLARHRRLGQDIHILPFLHYQLGGFAVGAGGSTPIPGLFLAGEMTGGLHGLNRLMGNGITDSLVHGRLAGQAAADWLEGGQPSS